MSKSPLATATEGRAKRPRGAAAQDSDAGLRELIAVREIAHAFLSARNPGEVYQLALDRVSPLVGASFACIYLLDARTGLLRLNAAYNWPEKYARFLGDMRVRLGHGPTGEAASDRKVVEVPDVFGPAALVDWREVATELGFRSLTALPLEAGGEVIGAATFYFADAGALSADSRGLLRVVADQMAATAEKARFVDDLTTAHAKLEHQYASLLEARRLQDEFLSNVSHELRTPLTAVMGYLSLMEEGLAGPITPEQQETLAQVKSSSEKLLGMIGDLLELTALKRSGVALTLAEFDPRDALRDAVAAARGKRETVTLIVEETPALPMITSDRAKITRLVAALLDNAFKFTERGEVRVGIERHGDRIAYRIVDTGIGISDAAREFIFEEFRQEDGSATRRYGGSGLGLAIARRLAHVLGGEITLSSEPGRGSTFKAELPLSSKAASS